MREIRSLGSVRGVPGNRHSYRDKITALAHHPRGSSLCRFRGKVASPSLRQEPSSFSI